MTKPAQLAHPPKFEHVRKLAESLIGRCHMSYPEELELEDYSTEELKEFDSIVFSCEQCGWWCSADECNEDDGWFCEECHEERHPKDED